MSKRITYLERRDQMPRSDFSRHWSTAHAEIARQLPGVTAYRQNHVRPHAALPLGDDAYAVDGIVELWFANEDVVHAAFDSDVADRLATDETSFLSGLTGGAVFAEEQCEIRPHKLWLLARWRSEEAPDRDAVGEWSAEQVAGCREIFGASANYLDPGAELLTRSSLRSDPRLPQIAIAFGVSSETAADTAAEWIAGNLDALSGRLDRIHLYLADEVVIV